MGRHRQANCRKGQRGVNSTDERRGATSASNAEADALCPGRHLAQRDLPQSSSGKDAEHGRLIHDALARNDPSKLTLEQRETFDACQQIEQAKRLEFFGEHAEDAGKRVFIEQRYWALIAGADGTPLEHSGKPDRVYRFADRALVVEYKTLAGEVESSPKNLQLRDLVVLCRGHFMLLKEVGVVVIQPFASHNPGICVYTKEDIDRAQQEMFARVIASNDPQSPRIAGEKQCGFCRAKMSCEKYQQWAGSNLPAMSNLLDSAVANWTPAQRAAYCERRKVAYDWLENCDQAMKAGLKADPDFIPGWRLRDGAKRETINNPQVAFDRFSALGGTLPQFLLCLHLVKTKLREQVNVITGANGRALGAQMDALTNGIVTATQSEPSLQKADESA